MPRAEPFNVCASARSLAGSATDIRPSSMRGLALEQPQHLGFQAVVAQASS